MMFKSRIQMSLENPAALGEGCLVSAPVSSVPGRSFLAIQNPAPINSLGLWITIVMIVDTALFGCFVIFPSSRFLVGFAHNFLCLREHLLA